MMLEYLQKSSQKIFLDKYQKIIIIINYSIKKRPIQERKWKKFIITKNIGLKIENLIKEDDILNL